MRINRKELRKESEFERWERRRESLKGKVTNIDLKVLQNQTLGISTIAELTLTLALKLWH